MAFVAEFDDLPGAAPIRFDEPEPVGSDSAPSAAAVLGAAVGNCLAASLAFCLRRARIDIVDLRAHVTTYVARNTNGRFRVRQIDVELVPVLGAGGMTRAGRCEELFEDFCIVTASVQRGIPVQISLKQPTDAAA